MNIEEVPLIGGHPALDFVNTVEGRGFEGAVDYLADYGTLAHWCARAGLLSSSQHAELLRQASQHPVVAARIWREASRLRDCLNRILRALANGDEPASSAMAAYNGMLQQAFANR